MESVSYRAALESDFEWAFELKSNADRPLVEKFFGWDDAIQRQIHIEEWNRKKPTIICLDGNPVGTYCIEFDNENAFLRRFFIHSTVRSQGLGSIVLKKILDDLDSENTECHLAYLRGNRAGKLYGRFGFEKYDENENFIYAKRPIA